MKKSKGNIMWVDEESVGFLCECGSEEQLVIGIYKDINYFCPKCRRKYILKQSNIVYEKK